MVEHILQDFSSAYNFDTVSLRYFNVAGTDKEGEIDEWYEPETHLIPLVLDVALDSDKSIKIYGTDYETSNGAYIRDYIHISDLADVNILALEYLLDVEESETFSLDNGKEFFVSEVINNVAKITDRWISIVESKRLPGDPPILVGCSEKTKTTLGWEPSFTNIDGIQFTAWK